MTANPATMTAPAPATVAATGTFRGADTEALDRLALSFRGCAGEIESVGGRLRAQTASLTWLGRDGDTFRSDTESVVDLLLTQAALLAEAGTRLEREAEEQRLASAAGGPMSAAEVGVAPLQCSAAEAAEAETTVGSPPGWPAAASPGEVHSWWAALSASERAMLIAADPKRVGTTDGIPVADRHRANLVVLADIRERLTAEKQDLWNTITGARIHDPIGAVNRMARVSGRLRGLDEISRRLDADPRLHLLGVGTEGDSGRMVVAVGNPDTARHIAVLVPGMTSTVDDAALQIDRVERIHRMASGEIPAGSADTVSTILWLDYNAPPAGLAVTSTARADAAAPALARFTSGLAATHQGSELNVTAIGHSYGSLVVGTADREYGLAVDDIGFLGSPGVGVNSAAQLSVGADRVYAATAPNDVINAASAHRLGGGALRSVVPGLHRLPTDEGTMRDPHLWFGVSPADRRFGGQVIATPAVPGSPIQAHSSYLDQDSPALQALARVIVGRSPDTP